MPKLVSTVSKRNPNDNKAVKTNKEINLDYPRNRKMPRLARSREKILRTRNNPFPAAVGLLCRLGLFESMRAVRP
jgi:hypothetical protein